MKYYIYRFLDVKREVLYIGKTKNLNGRIKVHFRAGHLEKNCYRRTKLVEYIVLDSKVAMDIYEIHFINKFQPHFNNASKIEGDNFALEDGEFEWKPLNMEQFSSPKNRQTKFKPDLSGISAAQKVFMDTARIAVDFAPDPAEEIKKIENLLKEATKRIYTKSLNTRVKTETIDEKYCQYCGEWFHLSDKMLLSHHTAMDCRPDYLSGDVITLSAVEFAKRKKSQERRSSL